MKLSLAFAVASESLVMLWMPNVLVLMALLHYGFKRYLPFALAIIGAEVLADYPTYSMIEAVCFGLINVGEATLAYLLLKRWRFNPRFVEPRDLARFLFAASGIAPFSRRAWPGCSMNTFVAMS